MPLALITNWWKGLEQGAKTIAAISIALIVAAPLWMESHFVTAEEMKSQVSSIKLIYLKSERRAIQKELFEWEVVRKKRPLTDMEQRRVLELERDLKSIEDDVKLLQQK